MHVRKRRGEVWNKLRGGGGEYRLRGNGASRRSARWKDPLNPTIGKGVECGGDCAREV